MTTSECLLVLGIAVCLTLVALANIEQNKELETLRERVELLETLQCKSN